LTRKSSTPAQTANKNGHDNQIFIQSSQPYSCDFTHNPDYYYRRLCTWLRFLQVSWLTHLKGKTFPVYDLPSRFPSDRLSPTEHILNAYSSGTPGFQQTHRKRRLKTSSAQDFHLIPLFIHGGNLRKSRRASKRHMRFFYFSFALSENIHGKALIFHYYNTAPTSCQCFLRSRRLMAGGEKIKDSAAPVKPQNKTSPRTG
jgi:hypothetical protein